MALRTADDVYEEIVKSLPTDERLRLVERIARELVEGPPVPQPAYDWMALRGIAPGLLGGEDAQEWVSRTRRESDEQRERQWRHEP